MYYYANLLNTARISQCFFLYLVFIIQHRFIAKYTCTWLVGNSCKSSCLLIIIIIIIITIMPTQF